MELSTILLPLITADQLICHAIGDYILQSDWMATEKTKRSIAALAHVLTYSIPFWFLRPSLPALAFIIGTHFVIDRWRLARYVVWAKNWICPFWRTELCAYPYSGVVRPGQVLPARLVRLYVSPWADCKQTGYPPDRAAWMAVWLLIIADNVMHVLCNAIALSYL